MKATRLLIIFLCFFSIQLSAQKKDDQKKQTTIQQRILYKQEQAKLEQEKAKKISQSKEKSKTSLSQKKGDKKSKARIQSKTSLEEIVKNNSDTYIITSEHVSSLSGTRHVYLRQSHNGIEIKGTESSIHYDRSGKVIKMNNRFIEDIQNTLRSSSASLSSREAISSVAQKMGYQLSGLQQLKSEGGINQKSTYNKAGISEMEIPVKLMYYYREGIGTDMVWELSVSERSSDDWWNFRVDASSGEIIDKDNYTLYCNILGDHSDHTHDNNLADNLTFIGPLEENKSEDNISNTLIGGYRVYAAPVVSPDHGGRTLELNPDNPTASPFGWHDTDGIAGSEYTITRGNNVYASEDRDGNNIPGYSPDGGGTLNFDFPINLALAPINNEDANITNLFYWNNIIHDVLYQYGFDETSGNFQENNYGNGGLGLDSVNADAQNPGNCNANFGTPPDGSNPRMQMFLCNNSAPAHDGDLDNLVIVHEYAHGISNRLTGGPANSGCLNNQEQMGEGWSDFYGLMFTMEPGDVGPDPIPVGTYLFGQPVNGPGIRLAPYSTNFAVNSYTYGDVATSGTSVHRVGFMWATMLWEMTWEIMGVVPFDADIYTGTGGNNIAMALVTEGLKLQPCSPGFVDGRDAILAADQALYGG